MPIQMPQMSAPPGRQGGMAPPPGRGPGSEVTSVLQPTKTTSKTAAGAVMAPPMPSPVTDEQAVQEVRNGIPVSQRCVDKNGKSIFLANVEIIDMATSQTIFKTRTNATGKWFASLGIGAYRVTIRKMESVTKEKIEAVQDIQVDGSKSKLELPMLIIK